MTVFTISTDGPAASDYRGCGEAWAAMRDGQVIALRYVDRGKANRRDLTWKELRDLSMRELTELAPTAVYRGQVSCWEFMQQSPNLL